MDQLTALKELAEKVEAGNPKGIGFADSIAGAFGQIYVPLFLKAYNGSLDAAHSLHKTMVQEGSLSIKEANDVIVLRIISHQQSQRSKDNTTPARAWLLAIIKAKIAELED